jgi:hypothetical protein
MVSPNRRVSRARSRPAAQMQPSLMQPHLFEMAKPGALFVAKRTPAEDQLQMIHQVVFAQPPVSRDLLAECVEPVWQWNPETRHACKLPPL